MAFWLPVFAIFPLNFFFFREYFCHVHMPIQRGMWPLHMTERGMARLPPYSLDSLLLPWLRHWSGKRGHAQKSLHGSAFR